MRSVLILALFIFQINANAQPYNRVIKLNMGISGEQFDHVAFSKIINDTGSVKMEFLSWSPTIAYSHEFIFGQILSVSGTVGFQYMNIYYGSQLYGAPYLWASVNPQLSLLYNKGFEIYAKLKVGTTIYIHHPEVIPEPINRLLPNTVNLFTGVTAGFNYFINDKIGLNLELSIWSPELATFGINYRFFRGELPKKDPDNEFKPPLYKD